MAKQIPASNRAVDTGDNTLITPEQLQHEHAEFEKELAELERQVTRIPARIVDEKVQGEWQEFIKELDALGERIESERERVKRPYLTASGIVDSHFKALYEKSTRGTPGRVNIARAKATAATDDFLIRKERAERERIAAEAEAAREEQRKAEEIARKAQEAARKAEEEDRSRAASNQSRKAEEATADASMASARAFELEQQARAKPAELSRTRSVGGTLGSLKLSWDFTVENMDLVKGAPLWAFVTHAAKEAAIRAYIKSAAPSELAPGEDWQPLLGVRMIQKRTGQYR